jgi:dienelactone hydrolase
MLNLVGAADDYTHPEPCEELAQRYAAAGVQIRTVKYADAHHGWDGIRPVRYVSDVTSAYSCGVITWNIEPWAIKSERTGQTIGVEGLGALMNSDCVKRGAHVGRNEAAYQQSRKDVQEFVSSVFFAGM